MWKSWTSTTLPQRRLPTLLLYRGTSRTSFDPSAAYPSFTLGMQQVAGNFTLDLTSQTTIYMGCTHEEDGNDVTTGQTISGDRPSISAIQIDEIVSVG
jgi:hypothetical protein